MVMAHKEDPRGLLAEDEKMPFNSGVEGGIDWDPKEFTMLRVESEKTNANGKPIAYDLMPLRMGSSRHKEPFTQHDLWVTRSHPERPTEMLYANLPAIARDMEGVEGADLSSSGSPPPAAPRAAVRDEDGKGNRAPPRLAVGRRLGGLGPGDVERLRSAPPQPLRPDALLPVRPRARPPRGGEPGGAGRLGELRARPHRGATPPMIDDYLLPTEALDPPALLSEWRWRIGDHSYSVRAVAAVGNLFLEDRSGAIFLLEIEDGSFARVARNAEEFEELLADRHNRKAWLQTFLVRALRNEGMMLGPGQCYGRERSRSSSSRGSDDAPLAEKFEPTDLAVHLSILGQIHRQVRDRAAGPR